MCCSTADCAECAPVWLQAALDDSIEHAREALTSSHDLIGMQRSCNNAFSLYKRTRPPAAPESVARAKALPKEGVHPLLAAQVPVTSGTGLEAQVGLNSAVLRSVMLCWVGKMLSCYPRRAEEPLQIRL